MNDDPRIRGICTRKKPNSFVYNNGLKLGGGFRIGSKVEYNGQTRFVYCIEYDYDSYCDLQPSNRKIKFLNLGDVVVSPICVKLIKI